MIELDVEARLGDFALAARLQAPADGTLALYGRSGSGKTSIVRAIAGLLRPARGRIAVAGSVFFDAEAGVDVPPEKRRLGYVFQDARLFPHIVLDLDTSRIRPHHDPGVGVGHCVAQEVIDQHRAQARSRPCARARIKLLLDPQPLLR